jgi:hypothetical protein
VGAGAGAGAAAGAGAGAPTFTTWLPYRLRLTAQPPVAGTGTSGSWAAMVVDRDAGSVDSTRATWAASSGGVGAAISALGRRGERAAGGDGGICGGGGDCAGTRIGEMWFAPRPRSDEDLPRIGPRNRSSTGWKAVFTDPSNIITVLASLMALFWSFFSS